MKKKWIVLMGCIIMNLFSVGSVGKFEGAESTESSISVMYINEVPFRCYEMQNLLVYDETIDKRLYVKAKDLEKLGFKTTYDDRLYKWYIERPNGEIATERFKAEVIDTIPNVSYPGVGKHTSAPRVFVEGVELYYSEYLDGYLVVNPVQLEKYYLNQDNHHYPESSLRIDEENYTAYLTLPKEHAAVDVPEARGKVRTTISLEDYLGVIPETDFRLYHGFYVKGTTYPILQITANGEKANYYYLYRIPPFEGQFFFRSISSLGYSYRIKGDKLVIHPTWKKKKIIGADRSKYFMVYNNIMLRSNYTFVTGYQTPDLSNADWSDLTCVELNDVYYRRRRLKQKGKFPAVISCNRVLMINEEILQQFIDIPVYENSEEKSEGEKQKQKEQEEKKANGIFLGLCAVVIIFYQLKKRKLF